MPIVRVEQKQERPFEVELSKDIFTIGRSSTNDLAFNNLSLSRHHARIIKHNDRYVLEDVGSRNGTFLNGARVRESIPLNPGDVIQLGEITLRFVDPHTERIQVTDTHPALGKEATFMIESDKIDIRRYAEEARSGIIPVSPQAENIWPALNQAAAALITHYSIDTLVEVIMDIVFQAVPADRGALILLDETNPEELQIKAIRNSQQNQSLQISRTILHEVMKNRKAVLTLDAQSDDRFGAAQSIQMQGIRSIICVPLWNEKEVIGLIYIDNLISRRIFTQSDLRLIALIANMAAVKIENALLMEEQLEKKRMEEQLAVAAQIQRRLLPQIQPKFPNYQIFGVNNSCYQIGGDYYDFITKDDNKLAIVIADVSGKGVAAALLMAVFQATIRTLVQTEKDINALVQRLNKAILENSPPNKYITVFYGELDIENHTFEYVNAGHNPPIYCTKGDFVMLKASGPVIGIVPNAMYRSEKIELQPGDLIFMYTDGITECVNTKDEEFGEEGVMKLLSTNHTLSVEDLSDMLDQKIREFTSGAPMIDDSTLIFLKRTA